MTRHHPLKIAALAALASSACGYAVMAQQSQGGAVKETPPIEAMGEAAAQTTDAGLAAPPKCTIAAVSPLAGADVRITDVAAKKTPSGAVYCAVSGPLTTQGADAGPGQAGFVINLPVAWNGKFLFNGGAGMDGAVPATDPGQIDKGYATAGTDSGHVAKPEFPHPGVDATWTRTATGALDMPKIVDYGYRSRHQVSAFGKALIGGYYGKGADKSYFIGCSSGGREALIEAQRYPESYDGFIAGNPLVDLNNVLWQARNIRALLQNPIPYKALPEIDAEVERQCDALDGVKDGLIQNPAQCRFNPAALVKRGVLTKAQGDALVTYLSPVRDEAGKVLSPGSSPTGMGDTSILIPGSGAGLTGLTVSMSDPSPAFGKALPWGSPLAGPTNWLLVRGFIAWVALGDPEADVLGSRVFDAQGRIRKDLEPIMQRYGGSMVFDPRAMGELVKSGHKVLIYQGYSDAILNPYHVITAYQTIAQTNGGYDRIRPNVRLFMAPEMQHCAWGSGPNAFDPLKAMEEWVEKGQAPDMIVAAKFEGNNPTKPMTRTMPLCPYPAMARYSGKGDVNQAQNWSCEASDKRLLTAK